MKLLSLLVWLLLVLPSPEGHVQAGRAPACLVTQGLLESSLEPSDQRVFVAHPEGLAFQPLW